MKIKNHNYLFFLALGFAVTALAYWWFASSSYFVAFTAWSKQNSVVLIASLLSIKIAGIVWPPIAGGLLTLGAIPILGWWQAYAVDWVGSLIGSSLAYVLARKWGLNFIKHIFDEHTIKIIQNIRVVSNREIEAIFVFRLFGANLVEIICYAAGLLRVRYRNFLLASAAAHMAIGLPFYFFARDIFSGQNIALNLVFMSAAITAFFILKKRYFTTWE